MIKKYFHILYGVAEEDMEVQEEIVYIQPLKNDAHRILNKVKAHHVVSASEWKGER